MRDRAALDGRRATALRAELLRRAGVLLAGDGQTRPPGETAAAILGVAARIGEEVTSRLDRVPDKQTDNLFSALGIGRDPARPARMPVAFRLAEPAPDAVVAPAATRLMATGETGPVVFETDQAIVLAPGSIAALVGLDAAADRIFQPPEGLVEAALPREPAVERTLASGVGAGADRLQLSLMTGIAPGTIVGIGPGGDASQHRIVEIEGDLVKVDPPLDRTLTPGTAVAVVTDFAPFAGHRDLQSHALYLGHSTLLNVPSALGITVAGLRLPATTEWSWWGAIGDAPAGWHRLTAVEDSGRLILGKEAGEPAKKAIRGRETLWLRARLSGASREAARASDIRLSVAGEGVCREVHTERCAGAESPTKVDFEAIANTTPVVLNAPFHPFGREPRLFDSFYVGCAEAFSKPGAEVSLCFRFAGPELGPLAAVSSDGVTQIFGVGKDGLLYRAQLGRDQPRLVTIAPSREETGGVPIEPQAPVAAWLVGKTAFVAIGGKGAVHLTQIPFEGPLEAVSLKWKTLLSDSDRNVPIVELALIPDGAKLELHAQTEGGFLLSWSDPAAEAKFARRLEGNGKLVPLQGADGIRGILLVDKNGKAEVRGSPSELKDIGEANELTRLAAWASEGAGPPSIILAGYRETARQKGEPKQAVLKVFRIPPKAGEKLGVDRKSGEPLPITFEPPPPPAGRGDPPTLLLASLLPERIVWGGKSYLATRSPSPIGSSDDVRRHFIRAPGWIAVHRAEPGLLYRRATADGRWAEEFVVEIKGSPVPAGGGGAAAAGASLAIASEVPFPSEYASPDLGPNGSGFELGVSARPGVRLLRAMDSLAGKPNLPGTASFYHKSATPAGELERTTSGLRLFNDAAKGVADQARKDLDEANETLEEAQKDAARKRTAHAQKEIAASARKSEFDQALLELNLATTRASDASRDVAAARTTLKERTDAVAAAETVRSNLPPAPPAAPAAALAAVADTVTGPSVDGTATTGTTTPGTTTGTTTTGTTTTGTTTPGTTPPGTTPPGTTTPGTTTPGTTTGTTAGTTTTADPAAARAAAERASAEEQVRVAKEREKAAETELERLEGLAGAADTALTKANSKLETARTRQEEAARALILAAGAVTTADIAVANAKPAQAAAAGRLAAAPPELAVVAGDQTCILLLDAGRPAGLWRLVRASASEWKIPEKFPAARPGLRYRLLDFDAQRPVAEAVEIENAEGLRERIGELERLGEAGQLRSSDDPKVVVKSVEEFDNVVVTPGEAPRKIAVIAFPALLASRGSSALLSTKVDEWSSLGPSQPPNPALSWEYWNGRSWWALDGAGLVDRTANLLVDNGVFFVVPADLEETEVGGRKNHWIRARLVGGDYGEAQVTVKASQVGAETHQIVERDMSTIRAPYVTSLRLGFCARTEVPPEVVLTEDSLGAVDQTAANLAGLPIPVFTPVAVPMNGTLPGAATFGRALMIGFERAVRGDPVSLYVDAAPAGAAVELVAEILRDGCFQPVDLRDETEGLSEPGTIQLSLDAPPDLAELFDTPAYWLRLRPRGDPPGWSPRIRGLWLNAVPAHSVETRDLERLGQSSGIADQSFRLAAAPVAVGSLELRVRERLGEEDSSGAGLDVVETAGTMPGPWVGWREVHDLGEAEGPERVFLLDAETGLIRFGDGRRGAIPPLGAELLAVHYLHVAGAAANNVAAGAALQLMSALGGIERVTALDLSAGGSDVESVEQARRRGAAKLRHGNRLVTLADLEDFVRARSPRIAQVRADNRGGAVRLVVAVAGADPRPAPALLRALAKAVRESAGYGIARPRGLSLVPPRLLPLRVSFLLEPDEPDRLLEMSADAEAALLALFDPATGGFDGRGWPIGRMPAPGDVSAALEPACRFGTVSGIDLRRADRPAEPLPAAIPADMLARLDPDDIVVHRRREAAA